MRCFIKDFAAIARPLTAILKREGGKVSKYRKKNISVVFNEIQLNAFDKLRNVLA